MRATSRYRLTSALLASLSLSLSVAACGGGSSLDGSIGDIMSLSFGSTSYFSDGSSLIVNYKKDSDLVCKLVIDALHSKAAAGTTLSGDDFKNYVTLSRVTANGQNFPPVLSGTLELSSFSLHAGDTVAGKFNALFNEGHTIVGTFSGTITTQ